MPFDKFLIGPFSTGWQNDIVKWLLPEDAFSLLENMYVWRGRLKKRVGTRLMGTQMNGATQQLSSRFRLNLGPTDGSGNKSLSLAAGYAPFAIGMAFSIGDNIYTVFQANGDMLRTGGTATTFTFNTVTGTLDIQGEAIGVDVYFYPAKPVMGLTNYITDSINNRPAYGFDTRSAYRFVGGAWETAGPGTFWQGSDTDFFWSVNWEGASDDETVLFTTNFNVTIGAPAATDDPIRYWDGTAWNTFFPYFSPTGAPNTGPRIAQARIIVPFQNRLLLLNVVEQDDGATTNTAFRNRVRFSKRGSPLDANSWYQARSTDGTNVGQGANFLDASTEEEILSVGFIKNRLIVYFEASTWELVFTANDAAPFRWQRINSELGSQSTFSGIDFDKAVFAVGNTGFHACNGANVERIDQKIPDEIFTVSDYVTGTKRIHGIRDYELECVYWTFPRSQNANGFQNFPNSFFVYNYQNGAWGVNDDSLTAFGYFQQDMDRTWQSEGQTPWNQFNQSWVAGLSKRGVRKVIAGNQEGFVMVFDGDESANAQALQITNISITSPTIMTLTIIDHNLNVGEYIQIFYAQGVTGFNDNIFRIDTITVDTVTIVDGLATFAGTYTGGGLVRRISQPFAQSKEWNPYLKEGRNCYIQRINFGLFKTSQGSFQVDYFTSSSNESALTAAALSGALLGDNIVSTAPYALFPYEQTQETIWHPVYLQAGGENVSIVITFSDLQLQDDEQDNRRAVALSELEIQGMILYVNPTASRME